MSRALALLALGGAAIAQETKIDVLLPGWNATNIGASIVGVEKSITTIVLECQDPKDFKCGIMYGGTVWQGDKTWSMHSSFNDKTASNSFTEEFECELDRPKELATCTVSYSGVIESEATEVLNTTTIPSISQYIYPIPVTAGADKLSAEPGASTTVPETTGSVAETGGASTSGASEPTSTPAGDDDEDAAASLRISAFGILAVVGGVLALL